MYDLYSIQLRDDIAVMRRIPAVRWSHKIRTFVGVDSDLPVISRTFVSRRQAERWAKLVGSKAKIL